MRRKFGIIVGAITIALVSSSAMAAKCSNNGSGFDAFKRDFAKEAKAAGIGRRGLAALASTQYSPGVIKYDRSVNRSFKRAKNNFRAFMQRRPKACSALRANG